MFGTAFAAPMHTYRLFIAPSLLVAIGMIGLLDRMWNSRAVRVAACSSALVVHLVFVARYLADGARDPRGRREAHRARARRRSGRGGRWFPPLPHANGDRVFFGDTARDDKRCRMCMAKLYGVKAVQYAKSSGKGTGKGKGKGKSKRSKRKKTEA